ncbi:hypothetical protein ASD15_04690 [Massilia sp. Root351]|jgi:hypothetical protein|uniref:hypothetical protein n=1 Tax=Massilia sp. Root351 TaxID=1736522 RepID=UPI00070B84CF|nr:hypothetical protein [Massilia sp. Root351]KQV91336.1 hypothetical protein ASD15_04690 [Massilia sp. Root351]
MQIILTGLHGDASEQSVELGLARFFEVRSVRLVRDGEPDSPWAVVAVADHYGKVWDTCNRLRGIFHRGRRLGFYIPLHQDLGPEDLLPHEQLHLD